MCPLCRHACRRLHWRRLDHFRRPDLDDERHSSPVCMNESKGRMAERFDGIVIDRQAAQGRHTRPTWTQQLLNQN